MVMFCTSLTKALRKSCIRWKSVSSHVQLPIADQSEKIQCYQIIKSGTVSPELPVPTYVARPDYGWNVLNRLWNSQIEKHTEEMIRRMRETCALASAVLKKAESVLEPGISTDYIDKVVHEEIVAHGAYPSTLHYKGYPKSCCTSVNNVVCHGIPDDNILKEGDIINIDVTVFYLGCHGDTSDTFKIGEVDEEGSQLIHTTRQCLKEAVDICRPGARFSDIPKVIEPLAKKQGYEICRHFVGHGIGTRFHAPPNVWHVSSRHVNTSFMEPGMIFTIEPILMEGCGNIKTLSDGWTVVSKDDSRSAQSEHTVLITPTGHEVLTL